MEASQSILLSDIWVNYHSRFSGASNDLKCCPYFSINSKTNIKLNNSIIVFPRRNIKRDKLWENNIVIKNGFVERKY